MTVTLNRVKLQNYDDEVFAPEPTSFTTSQGYDILTEKWTKPAKSLKSVKQKLSILQDRYRRASLPPPSQYASTEFTRKLLF